MLRFVCPLLGLVIFPFSLEVQVHSQAAADPALYAVSYVEVMPSAGPAMAAALTQYRDASRREDGCIRVERLEQLGRPGHFAIIEAWQDQQAFDAHAMAASVKQFRDRLEPIRSSDYDQRPYKPLAAAPPPTLTESRQAIQVVAHVDTIGGGQSGAPELLRRLAEASRQEHGCLRFDILQHATRTNHFTVIEIWENQPALDAHAMAPHTKQYRDALQQISGSPLDERLYRAVE